MGSYFFLNISTPHISIRTDQYEKYVRTIFLILNCTDDNLYEYCRVKKTTSKYSENKVQNSNVVELAKPENSITYSHAAIIRNIRNS